MARLLGPSLVLLAALSPTGCHSRVTSADRIVAAIEDSRRTVLPDTRHPLAQNANDVGPVESDRQLNASIVFKPSAEQRQEMEALLARQRDPDSADFRRWLTPERYAQQFGLDGNDLARVSGWLESQGLHVLRTARGATRVFFSGRVGQIEHAFGTELHHYQLNGERHFANASPIAIPDALVDVVLYVRGLNDFRPRAPVPEYSVQNGSGFAHFLVPEDFAKIYDVAALYTDGYDGTGVTLAIAGQTYYVPSDITDFRDLTGLPAMNLTDVLMPDTGSGTAISSNDLQEAELDLEWSGAVAKNATVRFVYVGDNSNDSVFDALGYAIDNDEGKVISISYGGCEQQQSGSELTDGETLIKQANMQGITVVASSGDQGAGGCEEPTATVATQGPAVVFPASVPEVTAAGGTEFNEGSGTYWSNANDSDDGSALSYIPEKAWNDTGSKLEASGGGASITYARPTWQTGTGVASGTFRLVPDIAMNASPNHDGYMLCSDNSCSTTSWSAAGQGGFAVVGGTSVAAPTFAGILTILNQAIGSSGLGNVNPTLYTLAGTTSNAFHDITTGNNIVPCMDGSTGCPSSGSFGYSAGVGYDEVTGLGSVDAANLLGAMSNSTTTALVTSTARAHAGTSVTLTATVTAGHTGTAMTGNVSFLYGTTSLGSVAVTAGTSSGGKPTGTAALTLTTLPVGTDSVTAQYAGTISYGSSSSAAVDVVIIGLLTLSPLTPTVAPKGAVTFTSAGGVPPVQWTLPTNHSGGSLVAGTGAYTAGTTANTTDVVVVTDSDSPPSQASTSVKVGPLVTISPSPASAAPRQKVTFTATGGNGTYNWSLSAAPSGGSISSSGVYQAGTTGDVTDTVKAVDSLGNTASVQVVVGPGVSITAPATHTPPRGSIQLQASGGSGTGFTWSIPTNASGATVTSGGDYTAGATGAVTDVVQVSDSLGNNATVSITVGAALTISAPMTTLAPRASMTLSASGGSGLDLTWTVSTNDSGSMITSAGRYTAGITGGVVDTVRVTDSLGNSATQSIHVSPGVTLSAPSSETPPRGTLALSATGGSNAGWAWSLVTNASGGSVSSSGVYKAGGVGDVNDSVRVTDSLGNTGSLTLQVTKGVSIVAPMNTVDAGSNETLTAVGGSGMGFVWSLSAAPSGGSITQAGTYTAGTTPGVTDVVAVVDSLGNSAQQHITVVLPLKVAASATTVAPKGQVTLTASGGSGTGYVWSLPANQSGGTITSAGIYTAGSTGSVTDTAQVVDSTGDMASTSISVGPGVSILPLAPDVVPGQTIHFAASGGSGGYAWSLPASPSNGSITADGVYTAGRNGGVADKVQATDSNGNAASVTVVVWALSPKAHAGCGCTNATGDDLASGTLLGAFVLTVRRRRARAQLG
jgi:hypothetical protein